MNLFYRDYRLDILDDRKFVLFVVENPQLFYKLNQDISDQYDGVIDDVHLSIDGKELNFKKMVEWMLSAWNLEVNDRSSLTKLHGYVSSLIMDYGRELEVLDLLNKIEIILSETLDDESMISYSNESIKFNDIFKLFNVKFDVLDKEHSIDLIIDFIQIKAQYMGKRLFILNQFMGYLNEEQLEELAKFSSREELTLLFLEGSYFSQETKFPGRHVIIDRDLCDIVVND